MDIDMQTTESPRLVSSGNGKTKISETPSERTLEGVDPRVVMMTNPASAAAEQYRILAGRLEAQVALGKKRIGVTSAQRMEGRTTTAINTAMAMARRSRVLLVDGDLRTPAVHTMLGLAPVVGLADVVAGRATLEEALICYGDDQLWVLPAGATVSPYAVVSSPRLRDVMAQLAAKFDAVLVNLPPALPTADVPTMAGALDALFMVIRAGRTRREVVALARAALPDSMVIGCVLNAVAHEAGAPWHLFAAHDRDEAARGVRPAMPAGAGVRG